MKHSIAVSSLLLALAVPLLGHADDNPFPVADPYGTNPISRLGYTAARNQIKDVLQGSYLTALTDVEAGIQSLVNREISGPARNFSCPGGGSARSAFFINYEQNSWSFDKMSSDTTFRNCVIDNHTLNGRYQRLVERRSNGNDEQGFYTERTFTGLSASGADGKPWLTGLTGVSSVFDYDAASEICRDAYPTVQLRVIQDSIQSVTITRAGTATRVNDVQYSETYRPAQTGNHGFGTCRYPEAFTISGTANLRSPVLGRGRTNTTISYTNRNVYPNADSVEAGGFLSAGYGDGTLFQVAKSNAGSGFDATVQYEGNFVTFNDQKFRIKPRKR